MPDFRAKSQSDFDLLLCKIDFLTKIQTRKNANVKLGRAKIRIRHLDKINKPWFSEFFAPSTVTKTQSGDGCGCA